MARRIINYTIMSIGGIFTLLMLLVFTRDTSSIFNWSSSGFVQCSVRQEIDSTLIFLKVTKEDFVSGNVPSRQDTLIIIAGQKADLNQWIETLELPHPPGKQVDIVYLNNGDTKIATVKTRPVQKSLFGNGMTRRTINPIFLPFI